MVVGLPPDRGEGVGAPTEGSQIGGCRNLAGERVPELIRRDHLRSGRQAAPRPQRPAIVAPTRTAVAGESVLATELVNLF